MTDLEFLEKEIAAWKCSPRRMMQIKGFLYYDGDHDVIHRKRTMIGEGGELEVVENLPNNRIVDNQYAKMVNQKANYLFGKPFTLSGENTAYIELLKKEDITEEERRSYIDTLERKSLRLKVLIEDLFEVSKANSNNIVLNKMELDVVNLIKQVSIEHVDKMKERGLELKWNVPEEKVLLMLDNQKTYRIFENLFVNVVKYAMQGSRVYLEVRKKASLVEIILKNMSAEEIHISGDEITERFVRGDSSRNTEGSGLGLAIAKKFLKEQGGMLCFYNHAESGAEVVCRIKTAELF